MIYTIRTISQLQSDYVFIASEPKVTGGFKATPRRLGFVFMHKKIKNFKMIDNSVNKIEIPLMHYNVM